MIASIHVVHSRRGGLWRLALLGFLCLTAAGAPASPQDVPAGPLPGEPAGPHPPREPVLAIGLLTDVQQVIVSCDGAVRVWRRGTGLRGSTFEPGVRLRLMATRMAPEAWAAAPGSCPVPERGIAVARVHVGRLGTFAEELIFEPLTPHAPLRVQGHAYRGEILVRPTATGLSVVNALRVEDYLRGVVPLEIGANPELPAAALEAQAIAARSYALYYLGRRAETHGCDLLASPEDQVYGGVDAEQAQATRAVLRTRGILAVYRDRPIRANYCSTCGGVTETAERVWPGERFAYLRSVRDGSSRPLCGGSPLFRWEECWSCAALERTVLAHLPEEVPEARTRPLGGLRDLQVIHRSPSGRAEVLEVETEGGTFRVRGDRIRWVVRRPDGGLLRSTLIGSFKRRSQGETCRICLEGGGYGHGVGLCQYGAIELGRQGIGPAEILRHYYRGIRLTRWW